MNIFSRRKTTATAKEVEIKDFSVKDYEDYIKALDQRLKDIGSNIDEITGTDYRIITVQDWLTAMQMATVPWRKSWRPNWVQLFDIFDNLVQDSHIQACVDTLKDSVLSKDFYIADENGERVKELDYLFKQKWFYDFTEAAINAVLYGFSLYQIDTVEPATGIITGHEVNRKHVRPDLAGVVRSIFDTVPMTYWGKEPYRSSCVFMFSGKLGKLNAAVRWYIYKTEVSRLWAKYNQTFSVPPIIMKTNTTDRARKENAIKALKNWLVSRYMVIHEKDEIAPLNMGSSASSANPELFEKLMRFCDEQISKCLLGSTMVLDNGSSRSQSEVHEENTAKTVKSLVRFLKTYSDANMLPILQKNGISVPLGAKLVFDNTERTTMKERAEIAVMLAGAFSISPETASEFVGIELDEKPETPTMPQQYQIKKQPNA